jgi:UPF0755 protein
MKKIIFYFIILLLIAGLVASAWFVFGILSPVKIASQPNLTIVTGDGVHQISYNLKQKNIIRNQFIFETYVYLKDVGSDFRAGDYSLPEVINIKRLVDLLTSGEAATNPALLVKEGDTIDDIDRSLAGQGQFKAGDFLSALKGLNQDFLSDREFLSDKPATASLEGYLFPDTYYFFSYSSASDLIRKMLNNFEAKLAADLRAEIKRQGKTIFDIVTLASIVEKEAKIDQNNPSPDANIVAGIFWKRLAAGMPLQSDATIKYETKRTPTAADLKIDSPYNTYLFKGLPPGPICNPGLAAIEAAIYPAESDYWFFITKKNQDGTVNYYYAKDFSEHKANIAKYLK